MQQLEVLADSQGCEPEFNLPNLIFLGYLIEYLSEIGEAKSVGGSISPIDWTDVKAWQDVTETYLSPGESSALIKLSKKYVNQYYESNGSNIPSPSIDEEESVKTVSDKFKALFSMMRNKN